MAVQSGCFLCSSDEADLCAACGLVETCSKHIRMHRNNSGYCFPLRVATQDGLGKHLVATRDIQQLEIIFEDSPLATGPTHSTVPVCLECGLILDPDLMEIWSCSECGSSLCSSSCQKGPKHAAECKIFKARGFSLQSQRYQEPAPEYQFLMTFRLLLKGQETQDLVDFMEDHSLLLSQNERNVYTRNVVHIIRDRLGCTQWSPEQILRYVSVVRTNACLGPAISGRGEYKCLLPYIALMNHSCRNNTRIFHRQDDTIVARNENEFVIRATVPIAEGETIYTSYTGVLDSFSQRREALLSSWHFVCECSRCEDMTDMGTYLDTILCQDCGGNVDPSLSKLDLVWKCESCSKTLSRTSVGRRQEEIKARLINQVGNKVPHLENYLIETSKLLHTNNHCMILAKIMLSTEYDEIMNHQIACGSPWKLKQVRRQVELCEETLHVLEKISPGISELKSSIILQLGPPAFVLVQNDLRKGKKIEDVMARMAQLNQLMNNCLKNYQLQEEKGDLEKSARCSKLLDDMQAFSNYIIAQPS